MNRVNLTIDGRAVAVPQGGTIMDGARVLGIDIPALCHEPGLPDVSACRLCLVEIEGSRKLEASCSTLARDGMVVRSETDRLVAYRRQLLQLLLDSHPNDCLTCQKAGDCLLQKYAYRYGVTFRNHSGAHRPERADVSSPYILKDNSKCILCGKCVRTCDQVTVERQVLAFAGRGYETRIVTDDDKTFETSRCVSCNRCVAVCPVGALTDRRLAGKIRPWEATRKVVTCQACSYGCAFELLSKDGRAVALRALSPQAGRPLCLKGRLLTELTWVDHPDAPWQKVDRKFIPVSWAKALGLGEVLKKLDATGRETTGS